MKYLILAALVFSVHCDACVHKGRQPNEIQIDPNGYVE